MNRKTELRPGSASLLWVVLGLLGLTGGLLAWVGVHALKASADPSVRQGLAYQSFLGAVDDLINEAGDSALVRFDEVAERVDSRRILRYDTIVVVADVSAFPSLDRAGFLFDQVQAYNRFQRERAAVGRVDAQWFELLRPYNPSVFRAYRRPDGSKALTRAPEAWSLRVRSPLEGEWDGEVRARDVRRDYGLLGPRLAASLSKPLSVTAPGGDDGRGKGRPCELVPSSGEVRAYCLSEERIAQATLRIGQEGTSPSWARAGWTDLWLDGRRIRPGDSVRMPEGSVLRLEPLEPVVFAEYWEGVLSSKQWVNGRMRRQSDLPPPLDLFSGLGAALPADGRRVSSEASLELAVDAEASVDLTTRLGAYLDHEVRLPLDFAMVILARIPSGEIVVVAEAGERRNRGRSPILERVAPGSAVKPLLAAAILSERPDLATLKIRARSGLVSSVMGMPPMDSRRSFSTALNCPAPAGGWVDLRYFLRCSNNEYAASLLVAGLAPEETENGGGARGVSLPLEGTRVPRGVLLRSPLSEGLTRLFDLPTDPAIADSMGRSGRVWEGLVFSDGTPVRVPTELLPSESRPALLTPGAKDGTDLSLLYRYAYGAWENQWTLLDLTNGFARVVTDRRLQLTFSPDGGGAFPAGEDEGSLGLGSQPWYPAVLGGLRDAADDGTARGLRSAWAGLGLPSDVLAKTGTLNEPGGPGAADDLFSKSLLFAVGDASEAAGHPLACGVVGGLYLRFSEGPESGSLPSVQVQFAAGELGAFLRENWEELTGCGT